MINKETYMYKTFKELLNAFWEEVENANPNIHASDKARGLLNQIAVRLDEIEDDVVEHDKQLRFNDIDDMKNDIDNLRDDVDDLLEKGQN